MPLQKRYVRDGRKRVIAASITTGYSDSSSVVRDPDGGIVGRTSDRFTNTRAADGTLISLDTSDPGLLIIDDD